MVRTPLAAVTATPGLKVKEGVFMYVKVPAGIKGAVARAGDRPFRLGGWGWATFRCKSTSTH